MSIRVPCVFRIALWAYKSKMANRTVSDARTVKGTNPQYLIEKISRSRIYESKYWKEQCFALTGMLKLRDFMQHILKIRLCMFWNSHVHCTLLSLTTIQDFCVSIISIEYLLYSLTFSLIFISIFLHIYFPFFML